MIFCSFFSFAGTGATTLAGLLSALRVKGESPADLHKQKVVIVGAGSAGTGVAQMLMNGKCLISFNGRFSTWFMVQIVIVQIVQMVQLDYGCAFFKTLSDAERRGGREA